MHRIMAVSQYLCRGGRRRLSETDRVKFPTQASITLMNMLIGLLVASQPEGFKYLSTIIYPYFEAYVSTMCYIVDT